MNRVYKTRWSVSRQQYVVTDEHHTAKDHKKTLIAAVVAVMLGIRGRTLRRACQGYEVGM